MTDTAILLGWTAAFYLRPSGATVALARQLLSEYQPSFVQNGTDLVVCSRLQATDVFEVMATLQPFVSQLGHAIRESHYYQTGLYQTEPTRPAWRLAGVSEAADILGVSKTRIGELRHHPNFPPPLFVLRATPVWLESSLIRYQLKFRSHLKPRS